jgi:hypothetical protein
VIAEISSEEDSASEDAEDLDPDTTYEACGFYAYENSGSASNEICVSIRTAKEEKPAPSETPSANPTEEPEVTEEPENGAEETQQPT